MQASKVISRIQSAPAVRRITVLESSVSELDQIIPAGTNLSFRYPCQLIVTNNCVGKSAFAKMLYTSICYANFFEQHGIAAFSEAFKSMEGLYNALSSKSRTATEQCAGGFCYMHASDHIFLKYLAMQDANALLAVQTGQHDKVGPHVLQTLFNKLRDQTNINKYFWIKFDSTCPVFPIYQDTIDFQEFSGHLRSRKNKLFAYDLPGIFDPTYDGKSIKGLSIDSRLLRSRLGIEADVTELSAEYFLQAAHVTGQELSPGKTAYMVWSFTKERIYNALEKEVAYVEEQKPRGSWDSVSKVKKINLKKDSKVIVFLDEPTTFLDPDTQLKVTSEIIELIDKYAGRLQFVITTNDIFFMDNISAVAETIDLSSRPAIVKDTKINLSHLQFKLKQPFLPEDYCI